MKTRKDVENSLSEKTMGLVGWIEHTLRVDVIRGLFGDTSPEMIFAVCTLDANGIGGEFGGGAATGRGCLADRYPLFSTLGAKRYDYGGQEWSEAIAEIAKEAASWLCSAAFEEYGPAPFGWEAVIGVRNHVDPELVVNVVARGRTGLDERVIPNGITGELDSAWVKAYAVGQIFRELELPETEIDWSSVSGWGRLIDALEE